VSSPDSMVRNSQQLLEWACNETFLTTAGHPWRPPMAATHGGHPWRLRPVHSPLHDTLTVVKSDWKDFNRSRSRGILRALQTKGGTACIWPARSPPPCSDLVREGFYRRDEHSQLLPWCGKIQESPSRLPQWLL